MNLDYLERSVRTKYEDCTQTGVLSPDRWVLANKVYGGGTTLLMKAAEGSDADRCVDFLARCGLDVNYPDRDGRRAIDYALDSDKENRPEAILSLLRHDSLLPDLRRDWAKQRFDAIVQQHEGLERFFAERSKFHEMIKRRDIKSMRVILKDSKRTSRFPRYWVNAEGESALYTAGCAGVHYTWALLKSRRFEYAGEAEKVMSYLEGDDRSEFNQAVDKLFARIPECHVYKMLSRSKVVGSLQRMEATATLKEVYKKLNEVPMTSLLLRCLQDEPNFEVIFDATRKKNWCVNAFYSDGLRSVRDPVTERVYVSESMRHGFEYSDAMSVLVHDLAHKALQVVFANADPYRVGDAESKDRYDRIVSAHSSKDHGDTECGRITRILKEFATDLFAQELIVTVPMIAYKHHARQGGPDGLQLLRTQEPELLEYYTGHVIPEMERYVRSRQIVNVIPYNDLLTSLCSDRRKEYVEVADSVEEPETEWFNFLKILQVSNLQLGLSNLEKSLEDFVWADWRTFEEYGTYFKGGLAWKNFKHMAIVWEENLKDVFPLVCGDTETRRLAKRLHPFGRVVTLVIPKSFPVPENIKAVEYVWRDLSDKTKSWILDREFNFQGRDASLKKLIENVDGEGTAESTLDTMLDADDISVLVDQEDLMFGRPLERALEQRIQQLVGNHPQRYIARSTRIRLVELNKEMFERRTNDAFFVRNADRRDLLGAGIAEACVWEGDKVPDGARCFILGAESIQGNEDHRQFGRITETLKGSPCPGENGDEKWQRAHFFDFEEGKYVHLDSIDVHEKQAVIIAGVPGSGKSVFINAKAIEVKKRFPHRWVEVCELAEHEEKIGKWNKDDFASGEEIKNLLYELMMNERELDRMRSSLTSSLEKKMFRHFCQAREAVFIFFDGFDAIRPDSKEAIVSFLEALQQRTRVSFFVSARKHECNDLEERLNTLVQNLVPFSSPEK